MPLSDRKLRSLAPREKPYKVFDGGGLTLEVFPNGSKLWRLQCEIGGKPTRKSLGPYPQVGLAAAREAAAALKARIGAGGGSGLPAPGKLFRDLCEDWAAKFLPAVTRKEALRKRYFLDRFILPGIGDMDPESLSPSLIMERVLRPVGESGHLETAHRVKSALGQILRYGVAIGLGCRDHTQDLRGALPQVSVRHRATILAPERIGRLMADIHGYSGSREVAMAMRLLAYLFARPGEIRHAEWKELDLEKGLWRIPAEKMKMRGPHIVPLATQVVGWLAEYREWAPWDGYLFPGARTHGKPISDMAINAALRYQGYGREEMTGHGFRAMASTILNENGFNSDWIERQLAHVERNGVRAAYNHADYLPERRNMMQWWADWLDSVRAGIKP
jgi:integrase